MVSNECRLLRRNVLFSSNSLLPHSEPRQLNTRELLQCSLEQLVSDINTKRKRDTTLLEGEFQCYLTWRTFYFLYFF